MAAPTFTCTTCATTFDMPPHVLDRYPGWTPRTCRRCRNAERTPSASAGRSSGDARTEAPRARGSRGGGRRAGAAVEENLTVAQVLERYDGGPDDGVFTDGSAHPNPGPGGWGAVWVRGGQVVDRAWGSEPDTTNNRMELTALIAGYGLVPPGEPVVVYTDSRLCVDTITKWAAGWARNGWRRKSGPVQNLDLVQRLYEEATRRPEVSLRWIKAHDGSRWNEYADALSTAYRRDEV